MVRVEKGKSSRLRMKSESPMIRRKSMSRPELKCGLKEI